MGIASLYHRWWDGDGLVADTGITTTWTDDSLSSTDYSDWEEQLMKYYKYLQSGDGKYLKSADGKYLVTSDSISLWTDDSTTTTTWTDEAV